MSCELCNIFKDNNNTDTIVYDRNESMIVLDCKICDKPIMIWQKHGAMVLSPGDMLHIILVLTGLFGNGILIDTNQYHEQNHLHWHVILDD